MSKLIQSLKNDHLDPRFECLKMERDTPTCRKARLFSGASVRRNYKAGPRLFGVSISTDAA